MYKTKINKINTMKLNNKKTFIKVKQIDLMKLIKISKF